MTKYLVLGVEPNTPGWHELGTYESRSAEGAVRAAIKDYHDSSVFMAVPERSAKRYCASIQEYTRIALRPEGDK